LARRGPVSVSEAVDYVLQTIEALAEAHAAGIVHRDLKPANLFLAERPDKTRIIKVLDFGISKSILGDSAAGQLSLTQTGMMMGSPMYMSPEQMQSSRDTDARCDIWALGIVLYQLLTGVMPFGGDSIIELCASVFRDRPPPIANFRSDVPAGLERVTMKCLERDREHRYQNAGELALALVNYAPSHARVHCERANRVLFPDTALKASPTSEVATNPTDAQPSSSSRQGMSKSPRALVGTPAQVGDTVSSPSPLNQTLAHETQAVWNSMRRPQASRAKWKIGGAVLLVVVAGSGAVISGFTPEPLHMTKTEHAASPVGSITPLQSLASVHQEMPATSASASQSVVGSNPQTSAPAAPLVTPTALADQQLVALAPARADGAIGKSTARIVSTTGTVVRKRKGDAMPSRLEPTSAPDVQKKAPGRAGGTELPDYGGRR